MSDLIWETFDGLFKTLRMQAARVAELEARVEELERRLRERAAAPPSPFLVRALKAAPPPAPFSFGLDPDAAAPPPTFAPLGFTLYDAEGNGTPILFPGAESRLVVLGVDEGEPGGDRGRVVLLKREENPEAGAPTRVRVVHSAPTEKESGR
jgi:hypothetical protein